MFVHCHNCHWEQDDFWSWSYNPLRTLLRDIAWLWKPRMVQTETAVFSWAWLMRCFGWRISAPFRQKWWTWKAYKRDPHKRCPKCGNGLCID